MSEAQKQNFQRNRQCSQLFVASCKMLVSDICGNPLIYSMAESTHKLYQPLAKKIIGDIKPENENLNVGGTGQTVSWIRNLTQIYTRHTIEFACDLTALHWPTESCQPLRDLFGKLKAVQYAYVTLISLNRTSYASSSYFERLTWQ